MSVLAPGAVVGGCRIEGVVGKGGMGVVYLARQLELERDVALKLISPDLTEDALARGRFLAEARAAAAVEHPNVVPVHAVGTEDDRAYLVMRFIRGDDLRTLVRRDGPLPPRRAAEIAERLGDALDAIHRAGYVHRDVKPPNVLIDDDDHVYLSDFGLAKAALATRGPTSTDHWVGTLDYVAPEQIRGEPVDARTDVYALGGVLHFMLTGRPPFAHEADEAKLWAHLHEDPPRPSEHAAVPRSFDAVVTRALAKDKVDRHDSAGELGRAALAAARGEDVAAATVTARTVHIRARRGRAPVPWAWIAGVVFAAAGGALLALASSGDGETAAGDRHADAVRRRRVPLRERSERPINPRDRRRVRQRRLPARGRRDRGRRRRGSCRTTARRSSGWTCGRASRSHSRRSAGAPRHRHRRRQGVDRLREHARRRPVRRADGPARDAIPGARPSRARGRGTRRAMDRDAGGDRERRGPASVRAGRHASRST